MTPTIPFGTITTTTSWEEPVTQYKQRLEAGDYLADNQPAADEADEDNGDNGPSLAYLRDEAAARGLPGYGTKAQLADRIAAYDDANVEADEEEQ